MYDYMVDDCRAKIDISAAYSLYLQTILNMEMN